MKGLPLEALFFWIKFNYLYGNYSKNKYLEKTITPYSWISANFFYGADFDRTKHCDK